jgi:methylmalonyl-CoA mutase cobalamin-binding subunit
LRELSSGSGFGAERLARPRRILLVPGAHEQHTFGLVMVSEFFRRAGWDVGGGSWATVVDAQALVAAEWFDALGISVGGEASLHGTAEAIRAVRMASCNSNLVVVVGGPIFASCPEYADDLGADAMTIDANDAPALAERLVCAASRGTGVLA